MGNEKKEEGKMQIPSENAFQGADIHGQFDSMGSESIDMGRMTASCVELLHRHLNMSTQDTGRILGLSDDEVTLINRMGRNTPPASIPSKARPLVQKMCAVQSLLLSAYSFGGMIDWFRATSPSLRSSPVDTLIKNGSEGVGKVLQATMGRMVH